MTANSATVRRHEARSAKTRARLIEAAISVIGAVGYEGASTRALAKAANTTMSAIPYHFGGKKELYLAAAQTIADYASSRFGEAAAILETEEPAARVVRFEETLTHLLNMILEDAESSSWTSFVARCSYENDEAFALIYNQAIAPLLERLTRAASDFSERSSDDEALRLRVSAIVTAIVSFRFVRGITLRWMDWQQIEPHYVSHFEEMVRDLCRSNFLAHDFPATSRP